MIVLLKMLHGCQYRLFHAWISLLFYRKTIENVYLIKIFAALCAATRGQEEKNKRKSFLFFVSSDQKPQRGVFATFAPKQGARRARKIFSFFFDEKSTPTMYT